MSSRRRAWSRASLVLAAALLAPLLPSSPAHALTGACPADPATGRPLLPSGQSCALATQSGIAINGPQDAAYIAAKVVLNDTSMTSATGAAGYRALLQGTVFCYNEVNTADQVFGEASVRNVWPGMGTAGAYVRGVLTGQPQGTYTCQLVADQRSLQPDPAKPGYMAPRTFTVDTSSQTVMAKRWGVSTPGPNDEGVWDPNTTNGYVHPPHSLLNSGWPDFDPYGQLVADVPTGAAGVTAVGMVNLTSCSFYSDTTAGSPADNKRPCDPARTTDVGSAGVKVRLVAYQMDAAGRNRCTAAGAFAVDAEYTTTITAVVHHATAPLTQAAALSDSASCSRKVLIKTVVHNDGARDIYMSATNSLVAGSD